MKCDELTAYNVVATADVNPEVVDSLGCTEWAGYDKSEVDAAIAELKAENERLKKKMDDYHLMSDIRRAKIKELKRALWLARAERAKAIKWHEGLERYLQERKKFWPSRFSFMATDEMYHVWYKCWCEVERKCRAKAEEYK